MNNCKKNIKVNSLRLILIGFLPFNFPIFQFFNLSIFQSFNLSIFLFLILNSSFLFSQPSLDNLAYTYKANTNQLKYITDAVGSATSSVDLDNQNSTNYAYDASGQLTKDEAEGILNIAWTSSGLVKQVSIDDNSDLVADRTLQFKYDALGNRVKKIETDLTGVNLPITTYYIRNATGELISIYKDEGSGIERKEVSIAVGTDNAESDSITNGVFSRNVGLKNYELKDHLGSVRVVINDVKNPVAASTIFTSNIQHAADYYSYGSLMPGRDYNISSYRFGYQGKEKDDEAKGNGNSYDFGARLLDPRVGRWLSIDPLDMKFPSESPYSSMGNNPISNIDPDGMAWGAQEDVVDEQGNIQRTLTFTGAVYDNSSQFEGIRDETWDYSGRYPAQNGDNSSAAQMQRFLAKTTSDIASTYSGSEVVDGHTVTWTTNVSLRVISNLEDLDKENKEHLIYIQDSKIYEDNADVSTSVGTTLSDLLVVIKGTKEIEDVTIPHEIGHAGGLGHTHSGDWWDMPVAWACGIFPIPVRQLDPDLFTDASNTIMDFVVGGGSLRTEASQIETLYNNIQAKTINSYGLGLLESRKASNILGATDVSKILRSEGKGSFAP